MRENGFQIVAHISCPLWHDIFKNPVLLYCVATASVNPVCRNTGERREKRNVLNAREKTELSTELFLHLALKDICEALLQERASTNSKRAMQSAHGEIQALLSGG